MRHAVEREIGVIESVEILDVLGILIDLQHPFIPNGPGRNAGGWRDSRREHTGSDAIPKRSIGTHDNRRIVEPTDGLTLICRALPLCHGQSEFHGIGEVASTDLVAEPGAGTLWRNGSGTGVRT